MATRTYARSAVISLLYAYFCGNESIRNFANDILKERKIKNAQANFALELFDGIINNIKEIDALMESNIKNWKLEKMGIVDKCIIRLGIYELIYNKLQVAIVINEAIEVAKLLGGDNTPKFVNGILDAISKKNQ